MYLENIEICKTCNNRVFDISRGIICGLTNSKPSFIDRCPDYSQDESEVSKSTINKVRSNESRAKYAELMIWIVLLFEMGSLVSDYFQYKLLTVVKNGGGISDSMANSNDTRQQIIGVLYLCVFVISAFTFINWFRRGYYNLHQRISYAERTESWALGCWFVPVICLYRPYKIMKEMWDESTNLLTNKSDYSSQSSSIIGWWWSLWIISSYLGNYVLKSAFKGDSIDDLISTTVSSMILSIIGIPLAILTTKMIRDYSKMESLLSGIERE